MCRREDESFRLRVAPPDSLSVCVAEQVDDGGGNLAGRFANRSVDGMY